MATTTLTRYTRGIPPQLNRTLKEERGSPLTHKSDRHCLLIGCASFSFTLIGYAGRKTSPHEGTLSYGGTPSLATSTWLPKSPPPPPRGIATLEALGALP